MATRKELEEKRRAAKAAKALEKADNFWSKSNRDEDMRTGQFLQDPEPSPMAYRSTRYHAGKRAPEDFKRKPKPDEIDR